MRIDIPTLAIVTVCISLLQTPAFGLIWFLNRPIPGLGRWALCSALAGLSLTLILIRQVVANDALTKLLPTVLTWAGCASFYAGAAAFRNRRMMLKWPLLLCIPALIGYVWCGFGGGIIWLRPLFYSTPVLVFMALGAWEMFHEERQPIRIAARFTAWITVLYGLSFGLRAWLLVAGRSNPEPLINSPTQVLIFATTLLWTLGLTLAVCLLVSQWHASEERRLSAAQLEAAEQLARASADLAATERELAAERELRQRHLLLRDLHDGIGGVTANLVLLASMGQKEENSEERQEIMRHIEYLSTECNREVRTLMDTLHGEDSDWASFLKDIREHAKHLAAAHRFALDWHVKGRQPRQPIADPAAQLSLARCIKEAVNNLARHSQARHAVIEFRFFGRSLAITVRDDGTGFQIGKNAPPKGRGLPNMQRRCEELGGRVRHLKGNGTTLRFGIPLPLTIRSIARKPPVSILASHTGTTDEEPHDSSRVGRG
ncbi:MAG: sensor histidine kinase [Steroidobacteraceae bacterium]